MESIEKTVINETSSTKRKFLKDVSELTEIITFRHVKILEDGQHSQSKVRVCPLEDSTGRVFTGQSEDGYYDTLNVRDREKLGYIVTPETYLTISDGFTLNPDSVTDVINWRWLQFHPYIAKSKDIADGRPSSIFYVENPEKDAQVRISKRRLIAKAENTLYEECSLEDKQKIGKLLGMPKPESFTDNQLTDFIASNIEQHYLTILSLKDPKKQAFNDAMILTEELISYGILSLKNAAYRFGSGEENINIGYNKSQVTEFLLNQDKNAEIIEALLAQLDIRKNSGKVTI